MTTQPHDDHDHDRTADATTGTTGIDPDLAPTDPAAAEEQGEPAREGVDPLDRGPVETDPLEPHGIGLTETLHHGSGPGDPGDGIAPGTDLGARP